MNVSSFDAAECEFADFARSNGYPRELRWIADRDAVCWRRLLLIAARDILASRGRVQTEYERAAILGNGLLLEAIASVDNCTICRLVVPLDEWDAELRLIAKGSVKMAATVSPPPAILVPGITVWLLRRIPGIDRLNLA